jgi:hypothetical protein
VIYDDFFATAFFGLAAVVFRAFDFAAGAFVALLAFFGDLAAVDFAFDLGAAAFAPGLVVRAFDFAVLLAVDFAAVFFAWLVEVLLRPVDFDFGFLAVWSALANASLVGAPSCPGLRIFSPLPWAIRLRFFWILA